MLHCVSICSVHVHPESVLPLPRGDPWSPLLHAHRHLESGLYSRRALHRLSLVPGGEWGRTTSLYHGDTGPSSAEHPGPGDAKTPLLWYDTQCLIQPHTWIHLHNFVFHSNGDCIEITEKKQAESSPPLVNCMQQVEPRVTKILL